MKIQQRFRTEATPPETKLLSPPGATRHWNVPENKTKSRSSCKRITHKTKGTTAKLKRCFRLRKNTLTLVDLRKIFLVEFQIRQLRKLLVEMHTPASYFDTKSTFFPVLGGGISRNQKDNSRGRTKDVHSQKDLDRTEWNLEAKDCQEKGTPQQKDNRECSGERGVYLGEMKWYEKPPNPVPLLKKNKEEKPRSLALVWEHFFTICFSQLFFRFKPGMAEGHVLLHSDL